MCKTMWSVFRRIKCDLPDEEDKKSPVLLLGVNKISDSPSFVRRRSTDPHTSGSIRFFRPPKSKYTRGLHGDERLEKIRQDLLVHKAKPDRYIPNDHEVSLEPEEVCPKLNCVGNCICDRKHSSNRGSFSFQRPEPCQKEIERKDSSENDIEFKYTEHIPHSQPSSSKQSYNVTPKSTERRHFLLANLNERFRKTLSLDSRKVETNRVPLSLPKEQRPKSLVNTSNICVQYKSGDPFIATNFNKASQPKKKRKSFFSLDTFFDSKKSDTSSIDDYCSSKYKRFELESDDSPLFRREKEERTPDLLNLPVIIDSVRKKQSDTRRQLEKLENHYYKNIHKEQTVIDAVPKDATDIQGPSGHNHLYFDEEVEYIEPIRSTFTSQSTLILDKKSTEDLKPDSILTINTDETDIRLPSSTVSPKSHAEDFDSIGAYEIEVKESDLVKVAKELTVKVMDKSVDSIGSCSLDVDASTDFSDTTSGSLNLLTPSSTTSRIRDFTSRIQERAASNLQPNYLASPTPVATPVRTPEDTTPTPRKPSENLLKPPPKVHIDSSSHRSRGHHKKRDEIPHKKPSYLNLACSVNGYTNLTTYDSKLRQDINKSREASPIRPITHTYQYRSENNSLLVPVPVSANKLLVPTFGPHDTRVDLTHKAPTKAHTDPYLATSPFNVYMAAENKQLKNDFLGNMTTTSRPYISSESKTFATSMLHKTDEVDNAKEITFKSSYSETNFRKTVTSNGKESRFSSESYTISSNGVSKRVEITKENGEKLTSPMKSFIQQRVERLYGPGALAQGFFNQKRHKLKSSSEDDEPKVLTEKSLNTPERIPRKIEEPENLCTSPNGEMDSGCSLPVLRHLRPEFRAQLPILSPKKSVKSELSPQKVEEEEKVVKTDVVESVAAVTNGVSVIKVDSEVPVSVNGGNTENGECKEVVKGGLYFLDLEKKETERLLALAATAEKELEDLQNREDVSEEILGLLRAASGKARLLATQKMQQFEGLCYNNINERLDEPFPTTLEDLQGFWDMVCLQVNNVNALYSHIAELKANNWQEIAAPIKQKAASSATPARARPRAASTQHNEKARLAAEKREADRKAMLEHRRRVARERQLAARATPGGSAEPSTHMGIEGSQEVEIFVGKTGKSSKVAPTGDCMSATDSVDTVVDQS
ncbi:disks large-associated protein 2 isoform X2 [Anticarsia gemmatalis]|uniref:disks large-associated protein 2 isoform X2 n=1 Tax=Anticarsia gemmatalis TaxID=129554 RepID=UPI003F76CA4E